MEKKITICLFQRIEHYKNMTTPFNTLKDKCWFTLLVPLVEKELLTLPEHLSSTPIFNGVRVTRSLVLCVMFCRSLFVLLYFFFWAILFSVLLRYTDSDYPFGISKLFHDIMSSKLYIISFCEKKKGIYSTLQSLLELMFCNKTLHLFQWLFQKMHVVIIK